MQFPGAILPGAYVVWAALACGSMGEKPPELLLAEQHRGAIDTASIELRVTADQAEPEPFYITTRFAGDDILYTYRGLADGRFAVENQPGEMFTYSELRYLMKNSEQWTYHEHTTSAHIKTVGIPWMPYYGVRDLGFEASPTTAEVVHDWCRTPAERYEVQHRPDAVEILGYWSNGFIVRFQLDPTRAMQPVRVETLADGEEAGVCVTEYQQIKDFWFPRKSTFTFHGDVITTITVLHAEFNEPHHPASFSPEDLGLTPGIDIYREPSLGKYRWSGRDSISEADWKKGVEEGRFDDRALRAMRAAAHPDATSGAGRYPKEVDDGFLGLGIRVKRNPGLWEDFTRRFIRFCQLDEAQTRKAWEVLKDCQEGAYERLPAIAKKAEDAESELVALRGGEGARKPAPSVGLDKSGSGSPRDAPESSDPDSKNAAPRVPSTVESGKIVGDEEKANAAIISALEERLDTLYEPIATIFEKRLKPELNQLLTPPQRERVARHDAEVKAKRAANKG